MKKRVFYTELAYLVGIIVLAFGTALMERADFGVSMVVAPAYLLHLKISEFLPFFSFGMAEYTLQAVLLIAMMLVLRRVRPRYFFSLVTAVLYGLLLDLGIFIVSFFPYNTILIRVISYILGMLICAAGVSLLFHTYIAPEAYELFVKEISLKYGFNINKVKTIYDCTSCIVAILMSFVFFGLWQFEGIKIGTVVCALLNGVLIGMFTKIFEKIWSFEDGFRFGNADGGTK